MVDKELLNEVLGCSCTFVYKDLDEFNMIHYVDNNCECRLNIHELAHKCKVWAKSFNYLLYSYPIDVKNNRWICDVKDKRRVQVLMQPHDTEPEAIFKACEYILKEMKQINLKE